MPIYIRIMEMVCIVAGAMVLLFMNTFMCIAHFAFLRIVMYNLLVCASTGFFIGLIEAIVSVKEACHWKWIWVACLLLMMCIGVLLIV